jgi:hypothetical protein
MTTATDFRRGLLNPASDEPPPVLETRRTALYFANPYRKRISEYEKVLLYSQPNPDWIAGGLGHGGWTSKFAGGRGVWENYFTEAKSSDWFAFRDPNGRWQFPYVTEKAEEWRETQRFVSAFTGEGLFRDIDEDWLEVVRLQLGAFVHHEYGLFMAHGGAIRDAFTDVLRVAITTGGLDHLDLAQMIQAQKMYLAQVHDRFSDDLEPSKQVWLDDPRLAGARTAVEAIWGESYDPIETVFAIYMVYEPLFGRFARREFFYRNAPVHGDHFTPWTIWSAIKASDTAATWAFDLFKRVLAGDPTFGAYNQKVMRMWADTWVPVALRAMADFAPLWRSTERLQGGDPASALARSAESVVRDWFERYATVFDFAGNERDLVSGVVAPAAALA